MVIQALEVLQTSNNIFFGEYEQNLNSPKFLPPLHYFVQVESSSQSTGNLTDSGETGQHLLDFSKTNGRDKEEKETENGGRWNRISKR